MERNKLILFLTFFLAISASFIGIVNIGLYSTSNKYSASTGASFFQGSQVTAILVRIEGEIHSGRSTYSSVGSESILAKLREIEKMPNVTLRFGAEVVAIVLCNHLFDAPDISDYKDITDLMNRNDKLVHAMKCKVLLSDSDISQWTNIVIEAFNALNIAEVFQLRTLVKMFSDSATAIRKKTAEQLQSWQQAQSGKWGTS